MDLLDHYMDFQVELLSRSENCSEGNQWVWDHVAQCLEETGHIAGFLFAFLAIMLCAISYVSLSVVHIRRPKQKNKSSVHLSSAMNLLSEIASLFGALLSIQLPSQILYSIILIPVHTLCYVYVCLGQSAKTNQKRDIVADGKRRSSLKKCMYPFHILLSAIFIVMLATKTMQKFISRRYEFPNTTPIASFQTVIPVFWLPGYLLGALAGLLFCCVRIIEMMHLYRSLDSNRCLPAIYLASILGGVCYIYSVLSQSLHVIFIFHTLPWTLPRLIAVGMDIGILIQRILYKKRGRKRKLSTEDAKCLLSSDEDAEGDTDFSDSDGEEVNWMPLKIVDTAKPYQPVSDSRVQIVSESSDLSVKETDEGMCESYNQRESDENNDDRDSRENSNILRHTESVDRNSDESPDILTLPLCNGNEAEEMNAEVKETEMMSKQQQQQQQQHQQQRFSQEDKHSSGCSSTDSNDECDHVLSNSIIKENIKSLTEVSKEEKIASWMNNSS